MEALVEMIPFDPLPYHAWGTRTDPAFEGESVAPQFHAGVSNLAVSTHGVKGPQHAIVGLDGDETLERGPTFSTTSLGHVVPLPRVRQEPGRAHRARLVHCIEWWLHR